MTHFTPHGKSLINDLVDMYDLIGEDPLIDKHERETHEQEITQEQQPPPRSALGIVNLNNQPPASSALPIPPNDKSST